MTLGKIMAIGTGTVTIVGGIAGAIIWVSSSVVWASNYKEDRLYDRQGQYEMRIDIIEERMQRAGPQLKEDLKKRLERYEKRLEEVDKQIEKLEAEK